jgi:hypothetical protein
MRLSVCIAVLCMAAIGCGKNQPAEVPKNPVPMEKPGAAADPTGGKGSVAQPNEKAQPLPK